MLQAAIDRAWTSRPIDRFWLHTLDLRPPPGDRHLSRAGFTVYARRPLSFEDPREHGILLRTLTHRLLPPLD